MSLDDWNWCPDCGASGFEPDLSCPLCRQALGRQGDGRICGDCGGRGERLAPLGTMMMRCPDCDGEGVKDGEG